MRRVNNGSDPLAKGEAKATGSLQPFRGTTTDNEHCSMTTLRTTVYPAHSFKNDHKWKNKNKTTHEFREQMSRIYYSRAAYYSMS